MSDAAQHAVEPDVLDLIEGFLQRHAMTASAFGTMAMGDPRVVFEMRNGRRVKQHNVALLWRTMEAYERGEITLQSTRSARDVSAPRQGRNDPTDDYDGLGEYASRKEMMRIGNDMFVAALWVEIAAMQRRRLDGSAERHFEGV